MRVTERSASGTCLGSKSRSHRSCSSICVISFTFHVLLLPGLRSFPEMSCNCIKTTWNLVRLLEPHGTRSAEYYTYCSYYAESMSQGFPDSRWLIQGLLPLRLVQRYDTLDLQGRERRVTLCNHCSIKSVIGSLCCPNLQWQGQPTRGQLYTTWESQTEMSVRGLTSSLLAQSYNPSPWRLTRFWREWPPIPFPPLLPPPLYYRSALCLHQVP